MCIRSSRQSSVQSSIKSTFSQRPEIPHYFLLSLIELWDDDNGMYSYGFAWSVLPHKEDVVFLTYSLLYFEPLCFLPLLLLTELFDSDRKDDQITDDFCMEFAKNLSGKWKYLAEHLNTVLKKYYIDSLVTEDHTQKRAPHEIAMEMLTHLKDIDHGEGKEQVDTFGGFCRSLLEISYYSVIYSLM